MSIDAHYKPRTDEVVLVREDGATFAIPAAEADLVAAAIRITAKTPNLARILDEVGGVSLT